MSSVNIHIFQSEMNNRRTYSHTKKAPRSGRKSIYAMLYFACIDRIDSNKLYYNGNNVGMSNNTMGTERATHKTLS